MKLRHWSANIVTNVHGRRQVSPLDPSNGRSRLPSKPNGFWVSDETRGVHGWRAWCKAERFRSYAMRYEHEVILSAKAKILFLRSAEDIDRFTEKYGFDHLDMLNKAAGGELFKDRHWSRMDGIDWKRVAQKYHGIIITPYIWERRLSMMGEHQADWYYTWDCASGCIWNARAIHSIKMIKEHPAPRKPTAWEAKRRHKRQMIKMAEASKQMVAAMQETRGPSPLDEELVASADKLIDNYKGGGNA